MVSILDQPKEPRDQIAFQLPERDTERETKEGIFSSETKVYEGKIQTPLERPSLTYSRCKAPLNKGKCLGFEAFGSCTIITFQ